MFKPPLFALLFIFIGLIGFARLAPRLFPDVNFRKLGAITAPLMVIVFGAGGFAFGWRGPKR